MVTLPVGASSPLPKTSLSFAPEMSPESPGNNVTVHVMVFDDLSYSPFFWPFHVLLMSILLDVVCLVVFPFHV